MLVTDGAELRHLTSVRPLVLGEGSPDVMRRGTRSRTTPASQAQAGFDQWFLDVHKLREVPHEQFFSGKESAESRLADGTGASSACSFGMKMIVIKGRLRDSAAGIKMTIER
jgi:hypothetical protein